MPFPLIATAAVGRGDLTAIPLSSGLSSVYTPQLTGDNLASAFIRKSRPRQVWGPLMSAPSTCTQLYLPLSLLFQRMRCPGPWLPFCLCLCSHLLPSLSKCCFIIYCLSLLSSAKLLPFTGSFPFKHVWVTHILKYVSFGSTSSKDFLVFLVFPFGAVDPFLGNSAPLASMEQVLLLPLFLFCGLLHLPPLPQL